MDSNEFIIEWLVRQRLADARASARRADLAALASRPRGQWRLALGSALIRVGRRLAESPSGASTVAAS